MVNSISQSGLVQGLPVEQGKVKKFKRDFVGSSGTVGTVSIFIAEDDDVARLEIRHHLERADGFTVVGEAADGESAVAEVVKLRPDVVFMKLELPGLDGLKATRAIKREVPHARVMIFGALNNDSDIYASFSAGANAYCLRSSTVQRLIMDLQAVNQGATWVDPQFSKRHLRNRIKSQSSTDVQRSIASEVPLSEREMEVLRLLAEGMSNQEIGKRLIVSPETVKTHVKHIMEKLAVNDRTLAVVTALRKGLVR